MYTIDTPPVQGDALTVYTLQNQTLLRKELLYQGLSQALWHCLYFNTMSLVLMKCFQRLRNDVRAISVQFYPNCLVVYRKSKKKTHETALCTHPIHYPWFFTTLSEFIV